MRDSRLDWIKGLLIVCVVLGHTTRVGSCAAELDQIVLRGIYGFHMPLFMLLSGYFFKFDEPALMARKTIRRLVLPYISGAILFGGVSIFQGRPLLVCLSNITYGRSIGALWFLYAVALVQIVLAIGSLVWRRTPSLVIPTVLVLFALAVAGPVRCEGWILFYWGAGYLLAQAKSLMPKGWLGVLGFVAFMYWGHPWYTELGWQTIGLSVCVLMVLNSAADSLVKCRGVGWLSTLGQHTMVILIFHPFFNTLFRLGQKLILHLDRTGVLFFLFSAAFSVAGCLILESILQKLHMGILFGIRSQK